MLTESAVADTFAVAPGPDRWLAPIQQYLDAYYDKHYIHQIGPDQEGFLWFWRLSSGSSRDDTK